MKQGSVMDSLEELGAKLTLCPAMYSMPQAISKAKPARVRGESGARLRPPGTEAGRIFVALRAARSSESRRPRIAYSMISMWGSARGIRIKEDSVSD